MIDNNTPREIACDLVDAYCDIAHGDVIVAYMLLQRLHSEIPSLVEPWSGIVVRDDHTGVGLSWVNDAGIIDVMIIDGHISYVLDVKNNDESGTSLKCLTEILKSYFT